MALSIVATCALAGAGAGLALAQAPGGAPTVVADHLDNPRGLSFGPDGSLYISEAGRTGKACLAKDECVGLTGKVRRLAPGGKLTTVGRGLVSVGSKDGTGAVGADDATVGPNGRVYSIITSAGAKPPKGVPKAITRQLGRIVRDAASGRLVPGAAVDRIEFAKDPDHQGKDSDPYSITTLNGKFYVTDAAGNDLLEVSGRHVKVIAVFPNIAPKVQSVPTVVRVGPDKALYVGELGGEKAANGASRVWRIVPGQAPTVVATGFTRITGLAFGPDGSLYVSEFSLNFAKFAPPGDVIKVAPNGTRTTIGTGQLFFPAGVAVAADGSIYVSNWSVLPGKAAKAGPGAGHNGQVVRFAPVA